jgi:poly-gamma-glutamate capsule biosynthesis protein CapA/YwtB (metallophosphatase superfamily)
LIGTLAAALLPLHVGAQNALAEPPPTQLRDQNRELGMKIQPRFTLVAVGDMLQRVPFSNSNDPRIQALMKIMRGADITVANNENTVVDPDTFTGPISHMEAVPAVAADWANMGIRMVTKANNHTFDDGDAGVWEDFRLLDRVGIVHVGVGRNLTEARLARYYATPKGTVAMVGIYANSKELNAIPTGQAVVVTPEQLKQLRAMRDSVVARRNETTNPILVPPRDPEGVTSVWGIIFKVAGAPDKPLSSGDAVMDEALQRYHESGRKRPTIEGKSNELTLTNYIGVTAPQLEQLRAMVNDHGTGTRLNAFGLNFQVTPGPGEYHYEMSPQAEREILREIRTGKQFADFEVAAIHWHQNRFAFQHYSFDHYPADYQVQFAHDAIDQGADAFVAHGVHTIKGVEIYHGKPIFYGVSNFVVQEHIFHSWRDFGSQKPVSLTGPIEGEGEANERQWAWMERPDNFEALLTSSTYENGKLVEVRIYPVDVGGPDRPGSQLGTPRQPSPEVAARILRELAEYSKPFGTRIDIQDGVGVIRIATGS